MDCPGWDDAPSTEYSDHLNNASAVLLITSRAPTLYDVGPALVHTVRARPRGWNAQIHPLFIVVPETDNADTTMTSALESALLTCVRKHNVLGLDQDSVPLVGAFPRLFYRQEEEQRTRATKSLWDAIINHGRAEATRFMAFEASLVRRSMLAYLLREANVPSIKELANDKVYSAFTASFEELEKKWLWLDWKTHLSKTVGPNGFEDDFGKLLFAQLRRQTHLTRKTLLHLQWLLTNVARNLMRDMARDALVRIGATPTTLFDGFEELVVFDAPALSEPDYSTWKANASLEFRWATVLSALNPMKQDMLETMRNWCKNTLLQDIGNMRFIYYPLESEDIETILGPSDQ